MLSISKLNESALECLGWPYESPGTNDQNGIDCSGLFVKMYRKLNKQFPKGSGKREAVKRIASVFIK